MTKDEKIALARAAVREAIKQLSASPGKRAYFHSVQIDLAPQLLRAMGAGQITTDECDSLVREAVRKMVEESELEASVRPVDDWKLLR
jgi:hypothetical protein